MESEAVQILREIRDEVRQTNARLDQTNARLGVVETTVLDLAEQRRFVVRHLRTLAERDHRLDENVLDLQRRVERLEERLGPG